MNWTDRYINIPFAEGGRSLSGCDCAGLVLLILEREKGVKASDFNEYTREDFSGQAGLMRLGQGVEAVVDEWKLVNEPMPFDLVRFRVGRAPCHVGIYVNNGLFIHVEKELIFSRVARLDDLSWKKRFIEFRRHQALMEGGHNAAA